MKPEHVTPRMSPREIVDSMRKFHDLKVLVVGDLFLDEYIEGEMFEISKEGPIPVIRLESKVQTAGAAGNLASSIRNLGAGVSVVGVAGKDANGAVLLSQMRKKGIRVSGVIVDPTKPTLTYTKVRARVENTPSREILRMDILPDEAPDPKTETKIIDAIRRESRGIDAIVVLDQIHHLITKRVLKELPEIARSTGALLHGSSRDHIADFRCFDLITPNDREASGAVGRLLGARLGGDMGARMGEHMAGNVERVGGLLKKLGRHRKVLLTLGAEGMAIFPQKGPAERLPTLATEVVDVTGAGDALSATALLGNVLGWDLGSTAWAASHAAAIAIAHVGTHHVSYRELAERILGTIH